MALEKAVADQKQLLALREAELTQQMASNTVSMQEEHAQQLQNLRAVIDGNAAEVQQRIVAREVQLQTEHTAERQELLQQLEQVNQEWQGRLDSEQHERAEATAALEQQLRKAQSSAEAQSSLQQQHAAELQTLRLDNEKALQELREKHSIEMAALSTYCDQRVYQLKANLTAQGVEEAELGTLRNLAADTQPLLQGMVTSEMSSSHDSPGEVSTRLVSHLKQRLQDMEAQQSVLQEALAQERQRVEGNESNLTQLFASEAALLLERQRLHETQTELQRTLQELAGKDAACTTLKQQHREQQNQLKEVSQQLTEYEGRCRELRTTVSHLQEQLGEKGGANYSGASGALQQGGSSPLARGMGERRSAESALELSSQSDKRASLEVNDEKMMQQLQEVSAHNSSLISSQVRCYELASKATVLERQLSNATAATSTQAKLHSHQIFDLKSQLEVAGLQLEESQQLAASRLAASQTRILELESITSHLSAQLKSAAQSTVSKDSPAMRQLAASAAELAAKQAQCADLQVCGCCTGIIAVSFVLSVCILQPEFLQHLHKGNVFPIDGQFIGLACFVCL